MSNENIAVVFDTNFIIAHISDLKEINAKLREKGHTPFITDISINERLSQKYLEYKNDYEDINSFKKKHHRIANISPKKSFDEFFDAEKERTLEGYSQEFMDCIIPFTPNKDTLSEIMDRVFKKLAPFSSAKGASDKGFKDTLLWFSLLNYFSHNKGKYNKAIFITEDGGFSKEENKQQLSAEFQRIVVVY